MDHVSGKFSLFLPDGTPARANLTVTFKEFIDVEVLVQQNPTQSARPSSQKHDWFAAENRLTVIRFLRSIWKRCQVAAYCGRKRNRRSKKS